MVTVLRRDGLRVVIYLNDHAPAHVHVLGDGETKVNLISKGSGPELVWADGASAGEVRRGMRLVAGHQAALLQRWEEIHGRAD